ncbi:hypothetical protein EFR00_00350 [Rhizobium sophoriradicis]|uniref:hypothetical protein n=1 Tax=Rhizobium sophoriradicis TaxID=1535245 RepID=UPI00098E9761|nr:hypothetical protein [Rhizobium sophoriradicis]RSC20984.1 hypothetical protein EFR00_00350 [Rhizobium sophoriradicis]
MLTTLTILSLDQGKIYSPPPEPLDEVAKAEINSFSCSRQILPTRKTAGIVFDWLTPPIIGLRRTIDRLLSVRSLRYLKRHARRRFRHTPPRLFSVIGRDNQ